MRQPTVLLCCLLLLGGFPSSAYAGDDGVLIDFDYAEKWGDWWVVNDDVMGGVSRSRIVHSGEGTAIFAGVVSLENFGGFASTRTRSSHYKLNRAHEGFLVRVRGDGKTYQLRARTDGRLDGVSYRYRFATQPGRWITVEAPFRDFQPTFRGRRLRNVPPISPERIRQIGFMISDKQVGEFRLEIDWVRAYE